MTPLQCRRLAAWCAFEVLRGDDPGQLDILRHLVAEGATPQRVGALLRRDLALDSRTALVCVYAARHLAFLHSIKPSP